MVRSSSDFDLCVMMMLLRKNLNLKECNLRLSIIHTSSARRHARERDKEHWARSGGQRVVGRFSPKSPTTVIGNIQKENVREK